MSCRKLSDLQLWAFCDGELTTPEQAVIERHVASCATCAGRLEQLSRPLFAAIMAVPAAPFHRQVMARVALEERGGAPAPDLGWLGPLLYPQRLALASAMTLTVALLSVAVVAAALAVPVVEAAMPAPVAPAANTMVAAVRRVLLPLGPFFQQWGWLVLGLGMLAVVLVPVIRALSRHLHQSL